MFADRGYEQTNDDVLNDRQRPNVDVVNWYDKDYLVRFMQILVRGSNFISGILYSACRQRVTQCLEATIERRVFELSEELLSASESASVAREKLAYSES
ncbi:hypothetical protein V6N13_079920 [Hibiscus sabdariffa]